MKASSRNPLIYLFFIILVLVGKWCYTPSIPVEAHLEEVPVASQASMTAAGGRKLPRGASRVRVRPLGLLWPLPRHAPGRKYGWIPSARDRSRTIFHNGVDVRAKTGTPLLAPSSGTVFRARWMGACGNGIILRLNRHRRVTTTLCHLNKFDVLEGQKVERGDKIGEVGSTGNSTTPHLHLAVHVNGKHLEPVRHFADVPSK